MTSNNPSRITSSAGTTTVITARAPGRGKTSAGAPVQDSTETNTNASQHPDKTTGEFDELLDDQAEDAQSSSATVGQHRNDNTLRRRASAYFRNQFPVTTYVRSRHRLVSDSYEARAGYLEKTRTYSNVIPTRGLAEFHYALVRELIIILMVVLPFLRQPPRPYFPRPSSNERRQVAVARQKKVMFYNTKVISVFVIKGGLGKTTRAILRALSLKRDNPELSVLVQDVDNGTLIYRIARTTILSMIDAVKNIDFITTKPDLMRYCTKTAEGLYVMAYKRDEENTASRTKKISRQEMRELIDVEIGKVDVIINDLAPNEDERNLGALDRSSYVEIIMTPAKDSLKKALDTYKFLIDNGYEELARNALLVVNRRMWWTNLDKIYAEFDTRFGDYMDNVKITHMGFSIRFSWGWDVVLSRLTRHNEITLLEDNAATAVTLADAYIDDPSTQKTHLELAVSLLNDDTAAASFNADSSSLIETSSSHLDPQTGDELESSPTMDGDLPSESRE